MYHFDFNDYEILKTYKDEENIKVYKIRNKFLEKASPHGVTFEICILKKIKKNAAKEIKEGSILKELQNCAKIVKCYGWYEKDDYYYIFIEYINGITLKDYVLKYKDELKDDYYKISKIAYEILKILEYVHSLEIIHRDLSYTNVMFDYDNQCWKLIDFGLSYYFKDSKDGSKYFSKVGTDKFMGPEVLTGHMKACRKSDIWSFGCLVILLLGASLEMLSIESDDDDECEPITQTEIEEKRDLHPIIPKHTHPFCKNFIKKCFFYDPEIRFDSSFLIYHPFILYFSNNFKVLEILKILEEKHKNVMEFTQKKKGIHVKGKEYYFKDDGEWSDIPNDTISLKFSSTFNKPIPDGVIPNSVKILEIGNHGGKFNHPLIRGKNIPNELVTLILGNDYSYDIDENLPLIFFSIGINRTKIPKLPYDLESFKYYGSFKDQGQLHQNILPPKIINLYLFNFNLPLVSGFIPLKVKLLVLFNFNHIDSLIYLPSSIDDLRIQCSQDVEKTIIRKQIPNHISLFILNGKILDIRENDDPNSLVYLKTIN